MIALLASQTSQTDHVQLTAVQAAAVALVGKGLCVQPSPGQVAIARFAGKGPCRQGNVLREISVQDLSAQKCITSLSAALIVVAITILMMIIIVLIVIRHVLSL